MLLDIDAATGMPPRGRFPSTFDELKATFVDDATFAASTTRAEIWNHLEQGIAFLRSILPVAFIWVGGSFTTNKIDPDDIDVVIWAEDRYLNAITDPRDAAIIQMFAFNQVKAATGLRLDTFLCHWHVEPSGQIQQSLPHHNYLKMRGYWDDFWLRSRSGAKTDPPTRTDALPRRGYFEVELEGLDVV